MSPVFVDTHLHLDDSRYDPDREALVQRAREAGVAELVTIGTTLEDSRWAAAWCSGHANVHGTVGVHPGCADTWQEGQLDELRALAKRPGIVAIGEVGLDFHRPEYTLAVQEPLFRAMLALAREARLPVVIHDRDAHEDTLRILREAWDPSLGGVFHCFAGDRATAFAAMDMNFDIAVGGVLTFKNAAALRAVVAEVPMERLVLETDGPWLAPQAWRGQRNEPAYVPAVAQALAALKGTSVEAVAEATTRNAERLFSIKVQA